MLPHRRLARGQTARPAPSPLQGFRTEKPYVTDTGTTQRRLHLCKEQRDVGGGAAAPTWPFKQAPDALPFGHQQEEPPRAAKLREGNDDEAPWGPTRRRRPGRRPAPQRGRASGRAIARVPAAPDPEVGGTALTRGGSGPGGQRQRPTLLGPTGDWLRKGHPHVVGSEQMGGDRTPTPASRLAAPPGCRRSGVGFAGSALRGRKSGPPPVAGHHSPQSSRGRQGRGKERRGVRLRSLLRVALLGAAAGRRRH